MTSLDARRIALTRRNLPAGLIHRSDSGSQYCTVDYWAVLRRRRFLISMSGKGNCYDKSMVETFFKIIKAKMIWPMAWKTRQQVSNAVASTYTGSITLPSGVQRSTSKQPASSSGQGRKLS